MNELGYHQERQIQEGEEQNVADTVTTKKQTTKSLNHPIISDESRNKNIWEHALVD